MDFRSRKEWTSPLTPSSINGGDSDKQQEHHGGRRSNGGAGRAHFARGRSRSNREWKDSNATTPREAVKATSITPPGGTGKRHPRDADTSLAAGDQSFGMVVSDNGQANGDGGSSVLHPSTSPQQQQQSQHLPQTSPTTMSAPEVPPQPYYPMGAIPHFVAAPDMQRGGPMFAVPPPPGSPGFISGQPFFENMNYGSSVPSNFYDPEIGQQPYFEPQPGSEDESDGIKAVVEKQGYISLHLRYDAHVDIAPNAAIRVINHRKGISLALSGCATQMALVHPQGRVLQYNSRIEVQTEDFLSIKNAKMWPRGVSFTSNNCALVYLVDQAGARSTTDTFHDLYADNIADSVFLQSCQFAAESPNSAISQSVKYLDQAQYWRTETDLDCWMINNVSIKQTPDGLVSVERKHGCELFTLKTSPSNGKARMQSSFLYLTASLGEESHIFVKSNDRRLHYNGHAFVVRNAGHSAGFDESGMLRIW